NRLPEPAADVVERLVPRDLLPFTGPARPVPLERIQDAIGIVELIRRHDALRARAPAAAGMERVAFDLPNVQRLLVDVGEDAARGFAVEADARNDPVMAPIFLGPARRLEVDVVVPILRIRV